MDQFSAQVNAAMVAGVVSLVVALITASVTVLVADRRGKLDERLAELKASFDRELAQQKARLDDPAAYAAERVAYELLMHPAWEMRSFRSIRAKLGGFDDEKLRQILVQAGAVRFERSGGSELWGLLERNRKALA